MEYTRDPETSMTVAVVEAVSAFESCEPTSLPPLYDAVDTDALDAMFDPDSTGQRGRSVSFVFGGHQVTVEDSERIVVEPAKTAVAQN